MKIGGIAPWFGAKRTLAPQIVEQLGPHSVYWEPFCGSCAVLLAKVPVSMETACDLHGDLVNLARVLQGEDLAVELYRRLTRLIFHEALFHEAAERWKARGYLPTGDQPDVDRAEEFMVCSWFGRNGVAGTTSYNQGYCVRYTSNGGRSAGRWRSVLESIPDWHTRLTNVTFLNRCGLEVLERIADEAGSVIFADPPYMVKGADYVHDFSAADHVRLAESLRHFRRTRVVVSYYAHPQLAELYPGWTLIECPVTKSLVNQGRRDQGGAVQAPEILLLNGRALGKRKWLF